MRRVSRRGRDAVCGSLRSDNNVAQARFFTKHQSARTWVPQVWIFTGAPSDRSSSLGWSETWESNEPNLHLLPIIGTPRNHDSRRTNAHNSTTRTPSCPLYNWVCEKLFSLRFLRS